VKKNIKPAGQGLAIVCSLDENATVTQTNNIDWCNVV
jgi:hypothetical protein